jgi:hypothetical protein
MQRYNFLLQTPQTPLRFRVVAACCHALLKHTVPVMFPFIVLQQKCSPFGVSTRQSLEHVRTFIVIRTWLISQLSALLVLTALREKLHESQLPHL